MRPRVHGLGARGHNNPQIKIRSNRNPKSKLIFDKERTMDEPSPVRIVRYMLILAAICASPAYVIWIAAGALCDRRGQRRQR